MATNNLIWNESVLVTQKQFENLILENLREAERLLNTRVYSAGEAQANTKLAEQARDRAKSYQGMLNSGILDNTFNAAEAFKQKRADEAAQQWASSVTQSIQKEKTAQSEAVKGFIGGLIKHAAGIPDELLIPAVEQVLAGNFDGIDSRGRYVRFAGWETEPLRIYVSPDGKYRALVQG